MAKDLTMGGWPMPEDTEPVGGTDKLPRKAKDFLLLGQIGR